MENELLGIGKVSALSGLPVSALRFYDGAGVLAPAAVDPSSGYRFYRPDQVRDARLVAHLRRVGMPLGDIRTVLLHPAQAGPVLHAHLVRLEAGLADARREISIVQHILDTTENPMSHATLPATDLVNALRDIRYAVSTDPDQPRLNGIYLDSEGHRLRLVATDRYRLATATVTTDQPIELHALVPVDAVDELLAHDLPDLVAITVAGATITFTAGDIRVTAQVPDVDFPSYRALLEQGHRQVRVDARRLRTDLAAAPTTTDPDGEQDISFLTIGNDEVRVGPMAGPDAVVVAVNRDYLLQALDAGNQLTLAIDDPIAQLAIRDPHRDGAMSILMPVRLDHQH